MRHDVDVWYWVAYFFDTRRDPDQGPEAAQSLQKSKCWNDGAVNAEAGLARIESPLRLYK